MRKHFNQLEGVFGGALGGDRLGRLRQEQLRQGGQCECERKEAAGVAHFHRGEVIVAFELLAAQILHQRGHRGTQGKAGIANRPDVDSLARFR